VFVQDSCRHCGLGEDVLAKRTEKDGLPSGDRRGRDADAGVPGGGAVHDGRHRADPGLAGRQERRGRAAGAGRAPAPDHHRPHAPVLVQLDWRHDRHHGRQRVPQVRPGDAPAAHRRPVRRAARPGQPAPRQAGEPQASLHWRNFGEFSGFQNISAEKIYKGRIRPNRTILNISTPCHTNLTKLNFITPSIT